MKYLVKKSKVLGIAFASLSLVIVSCNKENIVEPLPYQRNIQLQTFNNENGKIIPNQYIIVLKKHEMKNTLRLSSVASYKEKNILVKAEAENILTANGISQIEFVQIYSKAIIGFTTKLSEEQVQNLKKDYRIEYIEQDRIITLGKPSGKGKPGGEDPPPPQETPWGITRVGGPVNSASGIAWIIDTGVDLDHPDLNVDVSRSITFITNGPDSKNADDANGHGTHVAGTIAAIDNNIGVVGVAAGATVVAVKVLNRNGSGSYSGVIAGIDYVAQNASAGDVANLSLGGPVSNALDDAVRNAANAGILFAIAAGNSGADANNYSPARVENNNVWTVSAHNDQDVFASFSNWSGPTDPPIEFSAPGVNILSLWKKGGTNTISGTSMASPHVAGLLLLTGGAVNNGGNVTGDPDGDPDSIAHL